MVRVSLDIVPSIQYLVTVKIGTTVIGNSLNQSEQAILWSEICPNKSWLKNGKFRTALSAASGISDATLRRANDQNQSKMHNWSYSSTERSSAKELFDPKLAQLLFHLNDDKNGSMVATLPVTAENNRSASGKLTRGRPRRPDISDMDKEWSDRLRQNLLPWVIESAPVTSGTMGARRFRYPTWRLGFNAYRNWATQNNKDGIGYNKFREVLGDSCIGPSDYSYFVCPYCLLKDGDPVKDLHNAQCEYLFNAYARQKKFVTKGTLFLVVDWARIHECQGKNVEILLVEKGKLVWKKLLITFSDLGFAICVRSDGGDLETHFVNCFALLPQKGNFFKAGISKVAEFVKGLGLRIERIQSWADNGLRNYNCLYSYRDFFTFFDDLKEIQVCHFPPHHGHGLVDANFGCLKRFLRTQFYGKGPIEPMEAFGSLQNRPNTHPCLIPTDTKPFPIQVKPTTPGITYFHTFQLEKQGAQVVCRAKGKPDDETRWFDLTLRQSKLLYDEKTTVPPRADAAVDVFDDENVDDFENSLFLPSHTFPGPMSPPSNALVDDTSAEYLATGQSREDVAKLMKLATKDQDAFFRILSSFGRNDELARFLDSMSISPENIQLIEQLRENFEGPRISPEYYRDHLPSNIFPSMPLAAENRQ